MVKKGRRWEPLAKVPSFVTVSQKVQLVLEALLHLPQNSTTHLHDLHQKVVFILTPPSSIANEFSSQSTEQTIQEQLQYFCQDLLTSLTDQVLLSLVISLGWLLIKINGHGHGHATNVVQSGAAEWAK